MELGASIGIANVKAGPCPRCAGQRTVPHGTYRLVQAVERIVQPWAPEEREVLADELRTAARMKERLAVEQALRSRPGLREVAERLLVPRDAAAFWGLVAVLIAVIGVMSNKGGRPDVNVIQEATVNASPPLMPPSKRHAPPTKSSPSSKRAAGPAAKEARTVKKETGEEAVISRRRNRKTASDPVARRRHPDLDSRSRASELRRVN